MDNLSEMLEALLFASGKPMSVEQLSSLVGESTRKVKNSLKKLKTHYDKSTSALMIVEEDGSWKFTVREKHLPLVRKIVADTELPRSVIETLAVIAWRHPITQSQVIKIRSNKAYEHISELERLGFVLKEKVGRTFNLRLTEKFFDYFDISGNKDIREMFKNVKGMEEELSQEQEKRLNENNKQLMVLSDENHLGDLQVYPRDLEKEEFEIKETRELVEEIDEEEAEKEAVESEIDVVSPENEEEPEQETDVSGDESEKG